MFLLGEDGLLRSDDARLVRFGHIFAPEIRRGIGPHRGWVIKLLVKGHKTEKVRT